MAPRRAKSTATAPNVPKPVAARKQSPVAARQQSGEGGSDPNRLLREAAWSRMFGRTETKNPFTR
jgi:hypothetical protein